MSVSHRYKNFGTRKSTQDVSETSETEGLEDQKLEAFEAGYQAGWDDAIKAKADEREKLKAELNQNLLDMSFTYQEALSNMTMSLKPVLEQVVHKLLPKLASVSLSEHIVQQVQTLVETQTPQTIEIIVAEETTDLVEDLIGEKLVAPFQVTGSDELAAGRAFIKMENAEREVDLDTTISKVSEALSAFYHEVVQEQKNG